MPSYSYEKSIKSNTSDERINVYLQRPIAGLIVRALYGAPVTPNHLTIVSIIFGVIGGALLAFPDAQLAAARICFYMKDIFDSADGQLARAKQQFSRRGRFLDSIGDFVVNLFLFGGISVFLQRDGIPMGAAVLIGIAGFLGTSLRVSYHVFYHTSFLHGEQKYQTNRTTEEIRNEDYLEGRTTLLLQKIFFYLYGWQDQFVRMLDQWCFDGKIRDRSKMPKSWYQDTTALHVSGLLGLGTEYVGLTVCFLFGSIPAYLFFTLLALNGVWLSSVFYRKFFLASRIIRGTE